jgi:tRNA nucleotidyltransferase (CCA-adding enzyme)
LILALSELQVLNRVFKESIVLFFCVPVFAQNKIDSLQNLDQSQKRINQALSNHPKNSEIVQALRRYKNVTLILVAVRSEKPIRFHIWRYLTQLSQIHAPLNGNDLKEMGYKPGPQFKQILDSLLAATLDEKIRDRPEAELFLQRYDKSFEIASDAINENFIGRKIYVT